MKGVFLAVLCLLGVSCSLGVSAPQLNFKDRAYGSIVASFVADAACMGLHWIYDTKKIKELVGDGVPEFFQPPSCPYYHYPSGRNTPFGDQTYVLLETIANEGYFDPVKYEELNFDVFGPQSNYTGYIDNSTRGFLQNIENGQYWPNCGAADTQANALARMAPIVARYAGTDELLQHVSDTIRVTQNTDQAVAFGMAGARILEQIMLGNASDVAVDYAIKELRNPNRKFPNQWDGFLADGMEKAKALAYESHFDAVQYFGQSCDFPHNLFNGVQMLIRNKKYLHFPTPLEEYMHSVRVSILAGGDCGSRLMWIGACIGAESGISAVNTTWITKTTDSPQIIHFANKLLNN